SVDLLGGLGRPVAGSLLYHVAGTNQRRVIFGVLLGRVLFIKPHHLVPVVFVMVSGPTDRAIDQFFIVHMGHLAVGNNLDQGAHHAAQTASRNDRLSLVI